MKQFSLTIFILLTAVTAAAQRNPVEGYIITNQNDTIQGVIDYRTTAENCVSCFFKTAGEADFRQYLPGDIKGYRFASDGVYYISRTITIENKPLHSFVEFLIQGGVSLMHYVSVGRYDYYIFIGEDGKEVVVKDDQYKSNSEKAPYLFKERLKQRRELFPIFEKSTDMLDQLCKMPYKSENLTNLVHKYDETFCSDQVCVRYEYDRKKSKNFETRVFLEGGWFDCDYIKGPDFALDDEQTTWRCYDHSAQGLRLGVGLQMHSSRSFPALYYNVKFSLGYADLSGTEETITSIRTKREPWTNELWLAEFSLGAEWHPFYRQTSSPYLALGVNSVLLDFNGMYAGVGYQFPVGKHQVRLSASYTYSFFKNSFTYCRNHFDALVAFVF